VKLKGKMVGYLEAKDVPAFENGDVALCGLNFFHKRHFKSPNKLIFSNT